MPIVQFAMRTRGASCGFALRAAARDPAASRYGSLALTFEREEPASASRYGPLRITLRLRATVRWRSRSNARHPSRSAQPKRVGRRPSRSAKP